MGAFVSSFIAVRYFPKNSLFRWTALMLLVLGCTEAAWAGPSPALRDFNGLRTRQEKAMIFFGFERLSDMYWYRDVLNPVDAAPGYLVEAGVKTLRFRVDAPEVAQTTTAPLERPSGGFIETPTTPFPLEDEGSASVTPFPGGPFVVSVPAVEISADASLSLNPFTGPDPATGIEPGTFRVSVGPTIELEETETYQPYRGNYGFVDPEEFLLLFERQVDLPDGSVETARVPFSVPMGADGDTGAAAPDEPSTATYERN